MTRGARFGAVALLLVLLSSLSVVSVSASAYTSAVAASSPENYWQFDGSLADSAGSLSGGSFQTSNISCAYSPVAGASFALCGDGTTYVDMDGGTGASMAANAPLTIEAWIYSATSSGSISSQCTILGIMSSSAQNVLRGCGGTVQSGYSGAYANGPSCSYSLNAWHLVDAEFGTTSMTTYLDGSSTPCGTVSGSWPGRFTGSECVYSMADGHHWPSDGTCIGSHRWEEPTGNRIGQVAVYPSQLSTAAIAAHMAAAPGGSPARLGVTPAERYVAVGGSAVFSLQSVDAYGSDVTGSDTFTIASTVTTLGSATASCVISGSTLTCGIGSAPGLIQVTVQDSFSLSVVAAISVSGNASTFTMTCPSVAASGVAFTCDDHLTTDTAGTLTPDSYTITAPANVTCTGSSATAWPAGGTYYSNACTSSVPGTYTISFKDAAGLRATQVVQVQGSVTATPSPSPGCIGGTCGTQDVVSWLQVLVGYLQALGYTMQQIQSAIQGLLQQMAQLPGQITQSILSQLGLQLPTTYRGQTTVSFAPLSSIAATRSGLGCLEGGSPLPFPFSIPCDLLYDFSAFDATPVSPDLPLAMNVPMVYWTGSGFGTHTVAFTSNLNLGTMHVFGHDIAFLDATVLGGPSLITLIRWIIAITFTLRIALSAREWMGSGW